MLITSRVGNVDNVKNAYNVSNIKNVGKPINVDNIIHVEKRAKNVINDDNVDKIINSWAYGDQQNHLLKLGFVVTWCSKLTNCN